MSVQSFNELYESTLGQQDLALQSLVISGCATIGYPHDSAPQSIP